MFTWLGARLIKSTTRAMRLTSRWDRLYGSRSHWLIRMAPWLTVTVGLMLVLTLAAALVADFWGEIDVSFFLGLRSSAWVVWVFLAITAILALLEILGSSVAWRHSNWPTLRRSFQVVSAGATAVVVGTLSVVVVSGVFRSLFG
jgi:hypothetical protein